MLLDMYQGLQILHWALFIAAAAGFFTFWARTRFWLPKYVHFLAAIGLAIGLWCLSSVSDDAPINRQAPVVKALSVLALPALVYFFFLVHGGQRAAFDRRFDASAACPYCKPPGADLRNVNRAAKGEIFYAGQPCQYCGQASGG
jgi:hypothetical protein